MASFSFTLTGTIVVPDPEAFVTALGPVTGWNADGSTTPVNLDVQTAVHALLVAAFSQPGGRLSEHGILTDVGAVVRPS